uniref:Coiled-coil domain-containing protein 93 n=1 Tax=Phallusia mammillata TaxID=59560 RepID=A0A6F9D986_9ASCI|nr:coiled-coil domain-containing protein 93-like [Phallusia mammillata]
MSSKVFGKARASSKVGVELDQEGKAVTVETREDEEQQVKFKEIIDLLVAAGYFRARIKGLSPFDKVVGGMTWCISNCSFDIDVNLLFQENSTIGQKISLTEKIVSVLPKMKCPHPIEPHQIQGLDFKSIFLVIQWLVKKVIETREEMGDHIREFSISQFNKHHKMPQDIQLEARKDTIRDAVDTLHDFYRPVRKYTHSDKAALSTEEAKVSSTLLEYGRKLNVQKRKSKEQEDKMVPASQKVTVKEELDATFSKISVKNDQGETVDDEEEAIRIAQEKTLQAVMGGMSAMSGREIEGKLASKVIGSIVEMQSHEIKEISTIYAQKKAEIKAAVVNKPKTAEQIHLETVEKLKVKMDDAQEKADEIITEAKKIKQENDEVVSELEEARKRKSEFDEKMKELDEIEQNADKGILQKLRSLVAMNENLKQQEAQFKQQCKEEASQLQNQIDELIVQINTVTSVEKENLTVVEKQCIEDSEKLDKIRFLLAAKNRSVASLARKIDEVPTRAELTQYQRRFVELYNQIASKHKETKQFYTMYNTLDDTRRYVEKEVDLLDSIYDNFQTAKISAANMAQYLKHFEKIVEGIKSNKLKLEKKRQLEKMKRDELTEEYLALVEKHRLYVKTIRDFQEECRKNEILASKITE